MSTFTHAFAYLSAALFQAKESREDKGATAVEYGLLVALIAAAIIGVVLILGGDIKAAFTDVESKLPTATATPTT